MVAKPNSCTSFMTFQADPSKFPAPKEEVRRFRFIQTQEKSISSSKLLSFTESDESIEAEPVVAPRVTTNRKASELLNEELGYVPIFYYAPRISQLFPFDGKSKSLSGGGMPNVDSLKYGLTKT